MIAGDWLYQKDSPRCDAQLACGAVIVAKLGKIVLAETQFTCSIGIGHNKVLQTVGNLGCCLNLGCSIFMMFWMLYIHSIFKVMSRLLICQIDIHESQRWWFSFLLEWQMLAKLTSSMHKPAQQIVHIVSALSHYFLLLVLVNVLMIF